MINDCTTAFYFPIYQIIEKSAVIKVLKERMTGGQRERNNYIKENSEKIKIRYKGTICCLTEKPRHFVTLFKSIGRDFLV